ncbi:MAG: hypothetical protein J6S67_03355 [Methanobrevibacter sp.]|nr:hypothetical protein [Methanobrevibacter sp.]
MLAVVKLFMGVILLALAIVVIFMGLGASYISSLEDDDYVDEEVDFPKVFEQE